MQNLTDDYNIRAPIFVEKGRENKDHVPFIDVRTMPRALVRSARADRVGLLDARIKQKGCPARLAGPGRTALPFRAVNMPDTPGYDPGLQRHHLLPRQLSTKGCFGALFAEIEREWPGLDDFRHNGMLLPSSDAAALRIGLPLHRGPHRDYNAMVIERVGQIEAHWSRMRPRAPAVAHRDAVARLGLVQRALRRRLLDPGRKRLALNRHDPLGQATDFMQIDALVEALWPASDPWAWQSDAPGDEAENYAPAIPLHNCGLAASPAWA